MCCTFDITPHAPFRFCGNGRYESHLSNPTGCSSPASDMFRRQACRLEFRRKVRMLAFCYIWTRNTCSRCEDSRRWCWTWKTHCMEEACRTPCTPFHKRLPLRQPQLYCIPSTWTCSVLLCERFRSLCIYRPSHCCCVCFCKNAPQASSPRTHCTEAAHRSSYIYSFSRDTSKRQSSDW